MTKQNDVSTLFGGIGVDSGSYKELAAERQLDESLRRWSLLATVHKNRTGHQPKELVSQHPEKESDDIAPEVAHSQDTVTSAAPVTTLFQRISSQSVTAARAEPTISAQAWEQSKTADSESSPASVQTLFARLERANSIAQEQEHSPQSEKLNLFQRLLNQ